MCTGAAKYLNPIRCCGDNYAVGLAERKGLEAALAQIQQELPFDFPCIVNGSPRLPIPSDHTHQSLCTYHEADQSTVASAIDVMTATMLGQGKITWQAEIDAASELLDFFRFAVKHVAELYTQQPPKNSAGAYNHVEYRALEGFVLAVSPFNFTAIGGNLPGGTSDYSIPILAIVGNTVIRKPSLVATYSNYLVYQILVEVGVPAGVIQFVPGPLPQVVAQAISPQLYIAANLDKIVGETGGKNFYNVRKSADVRNTVLQSIQGDSEYQGQKCSALSRLYVSSSLWSSSFKDLLLPEVAKITVGYCIQPTIILTKDLQSITMKEDIFGLYNDTNYEKTLELVNNTSPYALTGFIFAADRDALPTATNKLRDAAYIYCTNSPCSNGVFICLACP
ncbi:Aldehyde/histidinol dehydrogenase [Suillus subluteus]|nr:Aldehyde/histidinol dehydrogenase [Suillus subluteus]